MSIVSLWLRFTVLLTLSVAMASPGIAEPETPSGGVIEGTVTDALTGEPLQGAEIDLFRTDYTGFDSTSTDSNGDYSLPFLPAGTYLIVTEAAGYVTEAYDDIPCHPLQGCDMSPEITPIVVIDGSTTSGIDIALDRGVMISGRVTAAATGAPVAVSLLIYDPVSRFLSNPFTSLTGEYASGLMPAGTYYVLTESIEYRDELYDDVPCPWQTGCGWSDGTPIELDWGEQASGIDLALDRFGAISGTVTDSGTGLPIPSIYIRIWREGQSYNTWAWADEAGAFLAEGLLDGTHFLATYSPEYSDELYEELPCEPDCEPSTGTPIEVSLEATTHGIDFALDRLAEISGRASHSNTGQPLEFVNVEVYDASGALIGSGETDTSGDYAVRGLPPGQHFAVATGALYLDQLYDGLPCEGGCDPTTGMPIAASLNTVTPGIDFILDQLGSIGGRVLHDGEPVTDARVVIYDSSGGFQRDAFTDFEGNYVADILPSGTYFAITEHDLFEDELYDNLPCEGGCDPTTGTPIQVSINSGAQDIDFDLGYCMPTATSLCLTGDRFRVEAIWEDFENATGPGFADVLTADAGTFWFFNPGNIELVVKILDICDRPENRFWVFAAGLTNVGVELEVTDELTGEFVSYSSSLGTPYETVLDTQAFDTCGAGSRVAGAGPAALPQALLEETPRVLPPGGVSSSEAILDKGDCLPSATTLCLNGGRFMAELTWLAPNGDGGPARAEPLTDETGYFWFGSVVNVEVVVKVLDACGLPSFQNYWVFGAGLTNFEVDLRITDTESGEIREYSNPQGRTFETITDVGHFTTCP